MLHLLYCLASNTCYLLSIGMHTYRINVVLHLSYAPSPYSQGNCIILQLQRKGFQGEAGEIISRGLLWDKSGAARGGQDVIYDPALEGEILVTTIPLTPISMSMIRI